MLRMTVIDSDNPYEVNERIMQIAEALTAEGYLAQKDYTIITSPNIVNITYGRDVGYKIEQEHFDDEIENISATQLRKKTLEFLAND